MKALIIAVLLIITIWITWVWTVVPVFLFFTGLLPLSAGEWLPLWKFFVGFCMFWTMGSIYVLIGIAIWTIIVKAISAILSIF